MSNGVPPSAMAASGSGAKANRASASTNRRISQAQAVRSMWGCGLVTQSMKRSLPARLDPELLRLPLRDGLGHRRRGRRSSGGPEIVAPCLQPEGAIQSAQLAERLAQGVGVFGSGPPPSAAPAQRDVANRQRGGGDLGVPRIGIASEQLDQGPILHRGETAGLPDPRGPPVLLDLLGEPFARLAGLGIGR